MKEDGQEGPSCQNDQNFKCNVDNHLPFSKKGGNKTQLDTH